MEIGSFIEMEFSKGREYYSGNHVARLNCGRAGIYHAARVLGCTTVYLPYYQCDTVRDFLIKKKLRVRYYSLDERFTPLIETLEPGSSTIVIVNYYGIMSHKRLATLAHRYQNVIIDNSQAFFCKPIDTCLNVYSARKFFGVPDGSYVIGPNASTYVEDYRQDFSSDTSQFLLQRIEYGCEGKAYKSRMLNEHRLDVSDVKKMSKLTRAILDGTNYDQVLQKRKANFEIADRLFHKVNKLDAKIYYDEECVPMVYPLVIENDNLLAKLLAHKIFQGHWWSYLLREIADGTFEYWLSRYMIPITIDQRYTEQELLFCYQTIAEGIGGNL